MRQKILTLLLCVLGTTTIVFGQSTVTGTIYSTEDNQPVPFATILVKGTTTLTTSADNGSYSITLPEGATTLVFSFFGMLSQEIEVGGRNVINVTLEPEGFMIEETVVIGYGTEKKRNVAGSIASVRSEDISNAAVENFQKALQGKAAGVQVTSASGAPGGAVSIQVRGARTISASTSPLYIIDGVQVTTGGQGGGILNSTDALAGLNPDDIESIDILKDGASSAIYGAQAANGVILITTKKGKAGKTKFSFKSSLGWQEVSNSIKTLNGPQFAEMSLTSYKNRYGETSSSYLNQLKAQRDKGWGDDGYSNAPTYDWFNAVFGSGFSQEYQLTMSGGGEKTTFFISGGFANDQGTMMNTWFKRINGRLNLSHEINKWLTFSTSNSFSNTNQRQNTTTAAANPVRVSYLMQPTNPIYDADGSYHTITEGYYQYNLVQLLDLNKYTGTSNKWISGNDFDFKIMEGLTFKSSYSVDYMEINEHLYIHPDTRLGAKNKGEVKATNRRVTKLQTDQVLNYQTVLNDIHRITATAGFSFVKSDRTGFSAEGHGVAHPDLGVLSSTTAVGVDEPYSGYKTMGIFARVGYILKDKYIFSGIIRRDGSSRFVDNKFGWFPSVSGAWRISDENFMKGIKFLDDMKIKASYGITGNADIGDFVSRRLYGGGVDYDGQSGLYPQYIGNSGVTWEKSHSVNLGLSASFLRNRLSAEVDFYVTNTKDLLYSRPIPTTTGFDYIPSNIGGIRNSGCEFLLNSENVRLADFKWSTSFNFAYNKNEVTSLVDGLEWLDSFKVGEAVTAEPTYRWAGVNPSDGRPMFYDKDSYITYHPRDIDRVWTDGRDPKFFGGLTNTFWYKGLEVSFTFQFQEGARSYWSNKTVLTGYAADCNSWYEVYENYWKYPGQKTWVAKPMQDDVYPASGRASNSESTLIYEKTDFIKLKTLSLSYSLPKKWVAKARLDGIQLYAQAYNLWTTTTYPGFDPEFAGNDRGVYPQSRVYNFGIKIDF